MDARRRRVHPPLSPSRVAQWLPSRPPLRPVRRRGSSPQHRARPPSAPRPHDAARRGGSRHRNTFPGAPMPILRRPDDRHRNPKASTLRDRHRRAGSGSTVHDHRRAVPLATPLLPRLRPPAGAARRCPRQVGSPSPGALPAPGPRTLATKYPSHRQSRQQDRPPRDTAAIRSLRPRPSNPHRSRPINQLLPPRGFLLGRLFERRPRIANTVPQGRRPKPPYAGID